MRTTNEIVSKLREHQSSTPSKWRENAEWRMANKSWLRYSQHIAMMMLDKMEELGMTQSDCLNSWAVASNMFPRYSKDRKTYPSKPWLR